MPVICLTHSKCWVRHPERCRNWGLERRSNLLVASKYLIASKQQGPDIKPKPSASRTLFSLPWWFMHTPCFCLLGPSLQWLWLLWVEKGGGCLRQKEDVFHFKDLPKLPVKSKGETSLEGLDKWLLRQAGSPTEILNIIINGRWKRKQYIGIPCSFTSFLARCSQARELCSHKLRSTWSLRPMLNELLSPCSLYLWYQAKSFTYPGSFNS